MTARVDVSYASTVAWCPVCPDWSAGAVSEANGHDLATEHDQAVHPGQRGAEINRHKFLRRKLAHLT